MTVDTVRVTGFYKYPAEHWIHMRTTNSIESTCSRTTSDQGHQGAGLRAAGIVMAYKVINAA